MAKRTPAEVFPPGEFLKEELEARGWSQFDLAEILGRYPRLINEIVVGKRSITPETAHALGEAFGTSSRFWMNLESAYRLSLVNDDEDAAISRRAQLYTYPVREMVRRGWIESSTKHDVLEHQLLRFFRTDSIQNLPHLLHATKKSDYRDLTPIQLAWLFRVHQLAEVQQVGSYSEKKLRNAVENFRLFLHESEEIKLVPKILADAGVRYLVVEGLLRSNIDGVCFWLNSNSPVIAMSLRYDRIDNFWFVLRHEIEHVLRRHGIDKEIVDSGLEGERALPEGPVSDEEKQANRAGAEFCVPDEELNDFIARVGPLYSAARIAKFAKRIEVHPGLVVGQLHNRKEIPFSHLRRFFVKIRQIVTETALTDGWGNIPQVRLP
ncbi:MAG: HigA family addiction module antitoxin [Acidiferrobacterales bacterium]